MANTRRSASDGDDVLLLDELDPVADELEPAVEPARLHGPEPALHVGHHLQEEDVAQDDGGRRDDRQHDHRLQQGGLPEGKFEGQHDSPGH